MASNSKKTINELTSAFGVSTRIDGNSFVSRKKGLLRSSNNMRDLAERRASRGSILNIMELATLWHLPNEKIKIPSIVWGTAVLSEPPANLLVSVNLTEEEKLGINFFAKTIYKNQERIFGIKDKDRRRHFWVVGKTRTGKSTLIANMVIDDFKKKIKGLP